MTRPWRTRTGIAVVGGEHLDGRARRDSTSGARMNTPWNGVVEAGDVEVGLEAVELAAVAVAAHGEVDGAEAALVGAAVEDLGGEQDHPGARAEHRHPPRCARA